MTFSLDRYPYLGTRERVQDIDEAIRRVREYHPNAHQEGSTGAERTFWVGKKHVAHAWPVGSAVIGRPGVGFWLRINRSPIEDIEEV